MTNTTVSISLCDHNCSVCIIEDGVVKLLLQEERITRKKHDSSCSNKFLDFICSQVKKIDNLVLVNFFSNEKIDSILKFFNYRFVKFKNVIVDDDNHHLYHAASAFYGSGFDEAVCLVIDGWGSNYKITDYTYGTETTSIYHFKYPAAVSTLYKNITYDPNRNEVIDIESYENMFDYEVNLSHHLDIGVMYGTVSKEIGFGRLDGGKTMGLSSYGKESEDIPPLLISGISNMNLFKNDRTINKKVFNNINNFKEKADLSFSVQKSLENVFVQRVEYILKNSDCKNIVFSGGCALNILGNSLIKKKFPEINLYVDPIANDACQSFGASSYHYHKLSGDLKIKKLDNVYLGPTYTKEIMKEAIFSHVHKSN